MTNKNEFREKRKSLVNQFPHLFYTNRPWAVGSDKTIRQFAKDIPEKVINIVCSIHTRSRQYLEASISGEHRITPDGRDAGPLSPEEKEIAQERLERATAKGNLRDSFRRPAGFVMPKTGFINITVQRKHMAQQKKNKKPVKINEDYDSSICGTHVKLSSYEMALKKSRRITDRLGNGDVHFSIWKCRTCGGYHFGRRNLKNNLNRIDVKKHKIEKARALDMDKEINNISVNDAG